VVFLIDLGGTALSWANTELVDGDAFQAVRD
jgi:hypothetical protein